MKKLLATATAFVWLAITAAAESEGGSLIPHALNVVLPEIHPGMSVGQVEAVLNRSYPGAKGKKDLWSGQTGYISFKLDKRFSLSVSAITREGKDVIHDEPLFQVYDWEKKRRVDLKAFDWEKTAGAPAGKNNNGEQGAGGNGGQAR